MISTCDELASQFAQRIPGLLGSRSNPDDGNPGAVLNMLEGGIADRQRMLLREEKAATKSDIGGNLALMCIPDQVREAL
ncbi:hypothetical protein [Bradyrhizobium sp. 151]|uniref:hypothetical protein n=1 Tax=Bradyrhizobium sp. 151 TaxID=2782626 RepID=UPI001FF84EAC|nr:hypothetical protein [Bradyrhizobium sp. 151]MCK1656482.1 hypothetical protein [Bradyrhizobium sp. 151]